MGLSVGDIYSAIQLMLAPVYVNDFVQDGRVKRVHMQADAAYRTGAESLSRIYTPSPLTQEDAGEADLDDPAVERGANEWKIAEPSLTRYNGYASVEIVGSQAPGHSSGEAMTAMQNIVEQGPAARLRLRLGGPVATRKSCRATRRPMLMVLSIVVVFLCLAALYESWSVPVAVLLVVPVGRARCGGAVDDARPAERHLLQDRPDHGDRSCGEERDPDRRVRDRGAQAKASRCARPSWKRRSCDCARS